MNGKRRLIAFAACVGLVLFLLTSSACLLLEAHHDCHGEGCAVCEQIGHLEALLRGIAQGGALLPPALAARAVRRGRRLALGAPEGPFATPVRLKVRLND